MFKLNSILSCLIEQVMQSMTTNKNWHSQFLRIQICAMGLADGEEHVLEIDPAAEPETIGDGNEDV